MAIKKMSYSGRVNEKFGEIMKEVKLLQRIRNDYVVELIGTFLKEKEYSAWIIMEYCLGSVSDCVEVRVFIPHFMRPKFGIAYTTYDSSYFYHGNRI